MCPRGQTSPAIPSQLRKPALPRVLHFCRNALTATVHGATVRSQSDNRTRGRPSMTRSATTVALAAVACAVMMVSSLNVVRGQGGAQVAVAIDPDDIGGVVTGSKGPEAGVWVIAETTELP